MRMFIVNKNREAITIPGYIRAEVVLPNKLYIEGEDFFIKNYLHGATWVYFASKYYTLDNVLSFLINDFIEITKPLSPLECIIYGIE